MVLLFLISSTKSKIKKINVNLQIYNIHTVFGNLYMFRWRVDFTRFVLRYSTKADS